MIARIAFVLVPVALLAACNQQSATAEKEKPAASMPMMQFGSAISPEQYAQMMDGAPGHMANVELIDVRTPEEFAEGHIEGATNIDWKASDFADKVSKLPKDKDYVLYCHSGRRSGEAQEAMSRMGFQNVASMTGGITAWQNGEMPVVK